MKLRLGVLLAVPVVLALVACAPVSHAASPTTALSTKLPAVQKSSAPTPTSTPVAPKATSPINAADYLVDGTPNVPDSNGEWFGEWAFFTDSTKTVWCEFTVFSGDNPGATCSIVPSAHTLATYPKPTGTSADCSTSAYDGYTLAIGGSADDLMPADAGWDQCIGLDPQTAGYMAKSKVLPDGATISFAPISCTVAAGVGTCSETITGQPAATLTLGLHTASFHSTS